MRDSRGVQVVHGDQQLASDLGHVGRSVQRDHRVQVREGRGEGGLGAPQPYPAPHRRPQHRGLHDGQEQRRCLRKVELNIADFNFKFAEC